jgi:hypothetical protein
VQERILGTLLKISSILTLLSLCAKEKKLPVLYLIVGKILKEVFYIDPSFSVFRRRSTCRCSMWILETLLKYPPKLTFFL